MVTYRFTQPMISTTNLGTHDTRHTTNERQDRDWDWDWDEAYGRLIMVHGLTAKRTRPGRAPDARWRHPVQADAWRSRSYAAT